MISSLGDSGALLLVSLKLRPATLVTLLVSLSLVLAVGVAAPNVAAAVLVSTAGTLVSTLHMLGPRRRFADEDALLREFDTTTTPLGALLVALMPLPAAWALVWVDYLSTNTVVVSVFFAVMCGLFVCLSMQGSRPQ